MRTFVNAATVATLMLAMASICTFGQSRVDPFAKGGGAARGDAAAETKADAKPANQARIIANVEFVDAPITTVFKMVSDLTGWSIIMSPEVSKAPPKINLWIKNMSPEQVLDRLTSVAGLVIERNANTVEVSTFDE